MKLVFFIVWVIVTPVSWLITYGLLLPQIQNQKMVTALIREAVGGVQSPWVSELSISMLFLGLLIGLISGILEWLTLRLCKHISFSWVVYTVLGNLAGMYLWFVANFIYTDYIGICIYGFTIALIQYRPMKKAMKLPGLWILFRTAFWIAGLVITGHASFSLWLRWYLGGLTFAFLSGILLLLLLLPKPSETSI